MKEKFLKAMPYIVALLIAIILIAADVINTSIQDKKALEAEEEYYASIVEATEVRYNGVNYHGVYSSEEITSIGSEYEYAGTILEMKDDEVELTEDFTTHGLPEGYDVYVSKEDTSTIYVDITVEGDYMPAYIPYTINE